MAIKEDRLHEFNGPIARWRAAEKGPFWGPGGAPSPDYALLEELLSIPVAAGDDVRTGRFAGALDLWVARELERAGFDEDLVWPRAEEPRAADPSLLRAARALRVADPRDVLDAGGARGSADVMGSVYAKQVDVGISGWLTGPELLVSTKTMSGSFGKNLANRFEEAYGDAKNLRGRHPMAAHGFLFLAKADILSEPGNFARAVHMLRQLGRRGDVYDAVALLLADWDEEVDLDAPGRPRAAVRVLGGEGTPVPADLSCEGFLSTLVDIVLANSPMDAHATVRESRWAGETD